MPASNKQFPIIFAYNLSLGDLTKALGLQAEIVKAYGELHRLSRDQARVLVSQLASIAGLKVGDAPAIGTKRVSRPSAFDKVAAFFVEIGNDWRTKRQIAEQAAIKEGTVHSLIYSNNPTDFESGPNPQGGRERAFRLTRMALEQAKDGREVQV